MNYQFENTIEELYSCLPNNRKKFNAIMDSMKRRFLKNDLKSQIKEKSCKTQTNQIKRKSKNLFSYRPSQNTPTKIDDIYKLTFRTNQQNLNPNIQNKINFNFRTQRDNFFPKKQDINNNKFSHKRSMSNGFQGTLPDALLISPRPLRTNSKLKIMMDTHANCNNFYPEQNIFYGTDVDNVGNGWHNQANNIMICTNENSYFGNK
jgi:hypothetical protein